MVWQDNLFATQFHPEKSSIRRLDDVKELRRHLRKPLCIAC